MSVGGDDDGTRWAARPTLARGLRVVVFLSPVVAAVGVSSLAHLALGAAGSRAEQAWHLAVLIATSTVALVAVDRIARRALPLATLLELSMLFPDRAPSRLAVARDAVRKRPVEEQLARVRKAGADPAGAAREILALVAAMRVHDRATRGHAERVRMLTDRVAEAMNVPERDRDLLRWAAILHDIGKLRVPPSILNKPGKPTEQEWAVLRAHPEHGAQIASALLPWLGKWGDVIVQHHERYDGTGYPHGLAGTEISLGGRLVAVADAYEVMTATRAYRRPISRVAAHRELVKWSGQQFDPAIVRAMVGLSAPRLRRAQGVIAWLSDIPLVASGYVPAATVARVVGAGALATGAATGVALPSALVASDSPPDSPPVSSSALRLPGASNASDATIDVGATANQADKAFSLAGLTGPPDAVIPSTATTAAPAAKQNASANGAAGETKPDTAQSDRPKVDKTNSANSGSGNSSSHSNSAKKAASVAGAPATTVGSTVGNSGKAVKGAAGGVTTTVDDTVGALTGPLAASGGPIGAVAGTVGAVTGTATGTVTGVVKNLGGLLGGKKT